MSKISLLDCTLRDGGYINSWQFGQKEINKIATQYGTLSSYPVEFFNKAMTKVFPEISSITGIALMAYLFFVFIGSLFPDIDLPNSKISNKVFLLPKIINNAGRNKAGNKKTGI